MFDHTPWALWSVPLLVTNNWNYSYPIKNSHFSTFISKNLKPYYLGFKWTVYFPVSIYTYTHKIKQNSSTVSNWFVACHNFWFSEEGGKAYTVCSCSFEYKAVCCKNIIRRNWYFTSPPSLPPQTPPRFLHLILHLWKIALKQGPASVYF